MNGVLNLLICVYDMSGFYMDFEYKVELEKGILMLCYFWILGCGDVEVYEGCEVKLEDDGVKVVLKYIFVFL